MHFDMKLSPSMKARALQMLFRTFHIAKERGNAARGVK